MKPLLEQLELNTKQDKVVYRHDLMPEEELTASLLQSLFMGISIHLCWSISWLV